MHDVSFKGSATPQTIDSWLKCNGTGETINDLKIMEVVGHDIYAIGTQVSTKSSLTTFNIQGPVKIVQKVDIYSAIHWIVSFSVVVNMLEKL